MKYLLVFLSVIVTIGTYGQQAPSPVIKSLSHTDVTCSGLGGTITITASDGRIPYGFSIDGGKNFQSTDNASFTFFNLKAGAYTILIRDANNQTSKPQPVTIADAARLNVNCSGTNPSCAKNSGTATVSVSGGRRPYTYSWTSADDSDRVARVLGVDSILTGLNEGRYTVVVKDSAGQCSSACSVTLLATQGLIVNCSGINPSCAKNSGTAMVSVSGGRRPYTYSWTNADDSDKVLGEDSILTGLSAGRYTVIVKDSAGQCSSACSVTLVTQGSSKPKFKVGDSISCGYIVYVDPGQDSTHPCQTHYLVCSFTDQNTKVAWYNNSYITTGATTDILFDRINALKIDSVSFAAQACSKFISGDSTTCTGWYLPSKTELDSIYVNLAKRGIGHFAKEGYWSSVESPKRHSAWTVDFFNGREIENDKSNKLHVRAVCEVWIGND